jgi:hypothetical protein
LSIRVQVDVANQRIANGLRSGQMTFGEAARAESSQWSSMVLSFKF